MKYSIYNITNNNSLVAQLEIIEVTFATKSTSEQDQRSDLGNQFWKNILTPGITKERTFLARNRY